MIKSALFLALLLLLAWLGSWLAPRWLRRSAAVVAALLATTQLGAWYLTGQWLDDRALKHLNWTDINQFAFQFKLEMGLFLLTWLALAGLLMLVSSWLRQRRPSRAQGLVAGLCLLAVAYPPGMVQPLWQSLQIAGANAASIDAGLQQLGIPPDAYPKPHQVTASPGKNILVISLESIEQGFLQAPLHELTPHLSQLRQDWTYFQHMPPLKGSDWTAASMYTLFTGLPALFNQDHFNNNDLFQGSQGFGLTTLAGVLQAAGYQTTYLLGKPEFAGMDQMLETFGLTVVSERNALGRYPKAEPGLHDLDLFAEAKLQLARLRQQGQPYALFLSTINTHFPNGILDPRMVGQVAAQDHPLAFNVSASDHLLGQFIQHLEATGVLQDTVVFIVPDHLMMGNGGPIINTLQQATRGLYAISSAAAHRFQPTPQDTIHQTDLPRLILQGAEIDTNARFLNDFLPPGSSDTFLSDHQVAVAALNNTALQRLDFSAGFKVALANRNLTVQGSDHQLNMTERGLQPTEVYQVIFNQQWVALESGLITLNEAYVNDHIDHQLGHRYALIEVDRGRLKKVTLSDRLGTAVTADATTHQFSVAELQAFTAQATERHAQWLAEQQQRRVPLHAYATDQGRFIAHAGGAIEGRKYTNSLEALNHSYAQGFRRFELDIRQTSDGHFVAVHDWPQWQRQTGFSGTLPPTHEAFLDHLIWQRFTPMDMAAINAWFGQHEDAILVTDKVNEPAAFVPQFIDPSRLMMELFSWSAVSAAQQQNMLAVILNGDLLFRMPGDPTGQLQARGIQFVASSRTWVHNEPRLLRQLNDAGIQVFAYHIGFEPGKDETHLVCHERNQFYGLYADQWDFKQLPECTP
ncbi:sulfatase-like hydrolase/transferase [Marinicella meishanensis]|uniref:sulfatase-like hydrolase/transferase n=1 Tax=Marinicella meishanensis TaxID=2873263 RepID=UPI001CC17C77|nr:sulfatase-like hydrolase/transferase [Marinicella sp. NBU2979]